MYQKSTLSVLGQTFHYYPLSQVESLFSGISLQKLPITQKILLENMLRTSASKKDVEKAAHPDAQKYGVEIGFPPARVLMQDFTGVPAIVDLAAMRDAMKSKGKDPRKVNPLIPVDLVIDHSVIVDHFGSSHAFSDNVKVEYQRNRCLLLAMEDRHLLRWVSPLGWSLH